MKYIRNSIILICLACSLRTHAFVGATSIVGLMRSLCGGLTAEDAGHMLLQATKDGDWDSFEKALKVSGVNVNVQDEGGLTPLHYACHALHSSTNSRSQAEAVKQMVPSLLEHDADLNVRTYKSNSTPLMYAVGSGRLEAVKQFLKDKRQEVAKADYQACVDHAMFLHEKNAETLQALRDKIADQ